MMKISEHENPVKLLKQHIRECDNCGESKSGNIVYLCDEATEINREISRRLERKDPTVYLEWPRRAPQG